MWTEEGVEKEAVGNSADMTAVLKIEELFWRFKIQKIWEGLLLEEFSFLVNA